MDNASSEKRRFYRHPMNVPIQYQEVHTHQYDASSTVDLSEGGLCFIAERFFPKGSRVHLSIPVYDQVFKVDGLVAYCTRITQIERYRVGIAFRDATSAFKAKLAEEILQIKQYQETLKKELGRDITEEEAARQWIAKYARQFSYLF